MFKKPFLASCSDRAKLPKENTVTGTPENWFNNNLLLEHSLFGVSFDFFINWQTGMLTPVAWVKRLLTISPDELIDNGNPKSEDIFNELIRFEGKENLVLFCKFCEHKNIQLQYILYNDSNWSSAGNKLFIVSINLKDTVLNYNIEVITLTDLQNKIREYSGGPVTIGRKGLMYGTSLLECLLSKTDSLYPGDVDIVIFNTESLAVENVIEFKKHNLSTPIENQKLSNYYPSPDGRKYNRLAILNNFIGPAKKFICLYYPTGEREHGKLESIETTSAGLVTGKSLVIRLPELDNVDTYKEFIRNVINF
ncbi:MAG: hypothetical protein H6550_00945 [Chitinophagales bacterium]|nr:hypothetical protein [Chitinophagales bacterium]